MAMCVIASAPLVNMAFLTIVLVRYAIPLVKLVSLVVKIVSFANLGILDR